MGGGGGGGLYSEGICVQKSAYSAYIQRGLLYYRMFFFGILHLRGLYSEDLVYRLLLLATQITVILVFKSSSPLESFFCSSLAYVA